MWFFEASKYYARSTTFRPNTLIPVPTTDALALSTHALALKTGDLGDWNTELPSCNTISAGVLLDLL